MPEPLLMRYLQPLFTGRRIECFQLVQEALREGHSADRLILEVVWPAIMQIDRLYRDDRINAAVENMATRINRTVADQLQASLPVRPPRGKRVLVQSAAGDAEEIGAQMVADLLQADGWEVFFIGGGIPHDELLTLVGQIRPVALVIFGTTPEEVPETRRLAHLIREIGVCDTMNIIVSGGIYTRADGLWQEVGADVYYDSARELLEKLPHLSPRTPGARLRGIVKKRHRRRKAATAAA